MLIAAHQSNWIPWLPFFAKMAQCDRFVILKEVQFEKNGYQNRCMVDGKWWTNPVINGIAPIKDKEYVGGERLVDLNMMWIHAIGKTLGINTDDKIVFDHPTDERGTDRIIELCKLYKADKYLTNMDALEKYLDAEQMKAAGIELVPFVFEYKEHVFESFAKRGIEGTRKLIHG